MDKDKAHEKQAVRCPLLRRRVTDDVLMDNRPAHPPGRISRITLEKLTNELAGYTAITRERQMRCNDRIAILSSANKWPVAMPFQFPSWRVKGCSSLQC